MIPKRTFAAAASRSRKLVKEEIDGGNLAVPGDDEIGSGVSRRLARAARHPTNPPPIAHHLRRGERLISEVRMRSLDHAGDAVDLVATAVKAVGSWNTASSWKISSIALRRRTGSISPNTSWRLRSKQGRYSVGHGFSRIGVRPPWPCRREARARDFAALR